MEVIFKFANHRHTIYYTLHMEQPIIAILKARLSYSIHLVYNAEITVGFRMKHPEYFSVNG